MDFASFDASVKAMEKLREACEALGLEAGKCKKLEGYVGQICSTLGVGGRARKTTRMLSKWQLCIKEKRAGKPFDPQAMKKLSVEYKAGTCPTKEFLEKMGRGS